MSIELMSKVFKAQGLKSTQKLVLLALADHANDEGRHVYPSVGKVASKTALTPRAVQVTIRQLETMKLIKKIKRGGGTKTNEYTIQVAGLTNLIHPTPESDSPVPPNDVHPTPESDSPKPSSKRREETSKKQKRGRDPRLDHPAITAYRDAAKLTPSDLWRDDIINTVTDLEKWKAILKQWIGKNYKPGNIEGLLEVYVHGWKNKAGYTKTQPAQVGHEPTEAELEATRAAIRKAQAQTPIPDEEIF